MPRLTNKELRAIGRAIALVTTMGVTIVASVGLGIFLGWLLDRWLGTGPWLLMVFSILGVLAAFKAMYDMLMRTMDEDK